MGFVGDDDGISDMAAEVATVGAELVRQIRKNTGEWCEFRTGIHFHEMSRLASGPRGIYNTNPRRRKYESA